MERAAARPASAPRAGFAPSARTAPALPAPPPLHNCAQGAPEAAERDGCVFPRPPCRWRSHLRPAHHCASPTCQNSVAILEAKGFSILSFAFPALIPLFLFVRAIRHLVTLFSHATLPTVAAHGPGPPRRRPRHPCSCNGRPRATQCRVGSVRALTCKDQPPSPRRPTTRGQSDCWRRATSTRHARSRDKPTKQAQ